MSTQALFLIAAVWIVIGLVVAFWMRRHGHDFFVWLILGAVLGPLSIPLAVSRNRAAPKAPDPGLYVVKSGGFDLLAGVDGSDDSVHALSSAIDLFGEQLSSVTLATVLNYDAESTSSGAEVKEEAMRMLEDVASSLDIEPVDTRVLVGLPSDALLQAAESGGFDLIVVGPRGHGASEALFGSVARKTVGHGVPVFVGRASSG